MERNNILKPHDIIIPLKFIASAGNLKSYRELSKEIFISIGEISEAIKRLEYAGLVSKIGGNFRINRRNLFDFLLYGVPYVYPTQRGARKKGMSTSYSTYPLNQDISGESDVVVWESNDGNTIGESIDPLYSKAPLAALQDERLYILLSLIDAIRLGEGRVYPIARKYLKEIIVENKWSLASEYE